MYSLLGLLTEKKITENCAKEHGNISILFCTYRDKMGIKGKRAVIKTVVLFPSLSLAKASIPQSLKWKNAKPEFLSYALQTIRFILNRVSLHFGITQHVIIH